MKQKLWLTGVQLGPRGRWMYGISYILFTDNGYCVESDQVLDPDWPIVEHPFQLAYLFEEGEGQPDMTDSSLYFITDSAGPVASNDITEAVIALNDIYNHDIYEQAHAKEKEIEDMANSLIQDAYEEYSN